MVEANILSDMLTALGVIFLGAVLFVTLRKQNEQIASVAFGLYILEAGLLAISRVDTFSLIHLSQQFVSAGTPELVQSLGRMALESMDFGGDTLHMLAFCPGAILFYYLLYRSSLIPRGLSLWGLIALIPLFIGTLTAVFGYDLPFVLFIPYVPFEFVIGIWIIVKGIPEKMPASRMMVEAGA